MTILHHVLHQLNLTALFYAHFFDHLLSSTPTLILLLNLLHALSNFDHNILDFILFVTLLLRMQFIKNELKYNFNLNSKTGTP